MHQVHQVHQETANTMIWESYENETQLTSYECI